MESVIKIDEICKKITANLRAERYTRPVIPYDIADIFKIMTAIGNGFIDQFDIDKENRSQIISVIQYFHNDPAFKCDLRKGLMLVGPKGTGKTLVMMIMAKLIQLFPGTYNPEGFREDCNTFVIERTKRITEAYQTTGIAGISRYNRGVVCFDDLGEEEKTSKFYSQEVGVMSSIITERYAAFVSRGLITHCTSNYPFEDRSNGTLYFQDFYGTRAEDRMKQMFNIIVFTGKSRRK